MANIIVRRWEHYNRAMGKHIGSKRQYENEMARGGYVSLEESQRLAEKNNKIDKLTYEGLSREAKDIIGTARLIKDKKGNIKPSDRLIDGMKKVGMRTTLPDWCPKHYTEGGFNAESNGKSIKG